MKANTNFKSRGFTIVELLIVIVIIAILAAISIVAYTGITQRANNSSAKAAAQSLAKKMEAYYNDNNGYPSAVSVLTGSGANGKSYQLPTSAVTISGTVPMTAQPSSTNTIDLQICTTGSVRAGYRIGYWDYTTGARTTTPLTGGDTTGTCANQTS